MFRRSAINLVDNLRPSRHCSVQRTEYHQVVSRSTSQVEVPMLCSSPLRRVAALVVAVATVLTLTLVVPMGAQEPGVKKEVPSADAQGKAEATIKKLFATRFKEAETDKAAAQSLAADLLGQAKTEKDDDNLKFV